MNLPSKPLRVPILRLVGCSVAIVGFGFATSSWPGASESVRERALEVFGIGLLTGIVTNALWVRRRLGAFRILMAKTAQEIWRRDAGEQTYEGSGSPRFEFLVCMLLSRKQKERLDGELGDLREDYRKKTLQFGERRAKRWYRKELILLIVSFMQKPFKWLAGIFGAEWLRRLIG